MRGIDDAALQAAVAFAAEVGTAQLVVATSTQVVVDEVWHDQPVDVYAVQKGLVSVLFGIAEHRGLLGIDDPVRRHLGEGWTQLTPEAEAQVTIARVLDMTTGMDDELGPLGEVGVTWRYDNVTYNYLKTVLEVAAGLTLAEVTDAWLTGRLGMSATRWVERPVLRPDGRPITGLESTARDLAAFGAFVLRGGDGLVPSGYLATLGRPGSEANPAWGRCWWNNDQAHHRLPRREAEVRPGPVTPEAPSDMIAARGAMENRLAIVPSLDLVVARTTDPTSRDDRPLPFDAQFWELLLRT